MPAIPVILAYPIGAATESIFSFNDEPGGGSGATRR